MMTKEFIMESFWQHPKGTNCALVAMIKVAILIFGTGKVFKTVLTNNQYHILLRNGKRITLTYAKVKEINKENCIVFSRYKDKKKAIQLKILKENVMLCYAVMVEYLHTHGFKNKVLGRTEAIEYF